MSPQLALCIAGPTGAGKTDLAIALANHFHGEIINGDSRQLYADFPIITAQPTPKQMALAPHHLYGILPTEAKMSAGEWTRRVARLCGEIHARGHLPIIVGGTGFYFEALMHGLAHIPDPHPAHARHIAERLRQEGPERLHQELQAVDPEYAAKIHKHDRQRIQRALEVYMSSGKNFTWWHNQGRSPAEISGPLLAMRATLAELEPRLGQRIKAMLAQGAIAEIARAAEKCPDIFNPGWSGIGCRELLAHWQGKTSLAECERQWLAATRAYAKRQLTWFRGRKNIIWLEDNASVVAVAASELQAHKNACASCGWELC